MGLVIKEYPVWVGSASFAGKSFDSVHSTPLWWLFQGFSSDEVHLFSLH